MVDGSVAPRVRAVLLDWRGTLVVAPTLQWLIRTSLDRLGREGSREAVDVVLDKLRATPRPEVDESHIDTDAALHRRTLMGWFSDAGLDGELAEALYAVESDVTLNPFAADAGDLLQGLCDGGVRVVIVSDIHVDLRPAFRCHTTPDGRSWETLVHGWALSYELGFAKPDPRIFTAALNMAGVDAAEALMVGDRSTHDGAAVETGIPTLLMPPLRNPEDRRLHTVLGLALPGR